MLIHPDWHEPRSKHYHLQPREGALVLWKNIILFCRLQTAGSKICSWKKVWSECETCEGSGEKQEVTLTAMKKRKKANRGLKARWPELEEQVHRWVLEQCAAGRGLSMVQLRLHALVVAKEMNINDFAGEPSWCYRFMQRSRLSIRGRTTTVCQKPPADFQDKVDSFREFPCLFLDLDFVK